MAWTNIHDEFLARDKHRVLSLLMSKEFEGWDETGARVVGQLAFLWGNSQAAKKTIGTLEDVIIWSQLYHALVDSGLAECWVESLCHPSVEILRRLENGLFEIVGNDKGVDYRNAQKERAALGGQKTKEKWEKAKKEKEISSEGQTAIPLEGRLASKRLAASTAKGNEMKGNERKLKNNTAQEHFSELLEEIYKSYPLKKGKDAGMKRALARFKTMEQVSLFGKAVRKYASECKLQRTDPKYIKHFSTFVGTDEIEPWRDFIPIEPVLKNTHPPPRLEVLPTQETQTPEVAAEALKKLRTITSKIKTPEGA